MIRKISIMIQVFIFCAAFGFVFSLTIGHAAAADVVYQDDFEGGWGDWFVDNGVWEIGTPTAGPKAAHGGTNLAGTVLDGNYPGETDSRLISPSMSFPAVSGNEELRLCFWQWFSYSSYDYGVVQISLWDPDAAAWSAWEDVSGKMVSVSSVWSRTCVDLTQYAGQKVKIAFFHFAAAGSSGDVSTGWYIDDIKIEKFVPSFEGSFELGWGDWFVDRGVWEIGTPTAGPKAAHGGTNLAGTVLDGNYPGETDSRLISPSMSFPAVSGNEELRLCFWQWFSYSSYDYGVVQISLWDPDAAAWSAWEDVSGKMVSVSSVWSRTCVDLTQYAGQKVKIAFFHFAAAGSSGDVSTGWYIDDIKIEKFVPSFEGSFELGWGDWFVDRGVWEIGTPTAGPKAAHGGTNLAGTVLDGNYPGETDSRLISPSMSFPAVSGNEELRLCFWQWFSYSSYDYGVVQISLWDPDAAAWSAWEDVSGKMVSVSSVWSRTCVDLTQYAGQKVKIAFFHFAAAGSSGDVSTGWYIDDVNFNFNFAIPCPQCTGDPVMLQNVAFEAGTACECKATTYITIGSGVTIPSGAIVTFIAPRINVEPGFHAERGSVVNMRQH